MPRHTESPKKIFYEAILPRLIKKTPALRDLYWGSACEQWVNGECFIGLKQFFKNDPVWVSSEWKKRDLALFTYRDLENPDLKSPDRLFLGIEAKALYSYYSHKKQISILKKLSAQLETIRQEAEKYNPAVKDGSSKKISILGLVIAFDREYLDEDNNWVNIKGRPCQLIKPKAFREAGLKIAFGHSGGYSLIDNWKKVKMSFHTHRIKVKVWPLELI